MAIREDAAQPEKVWSPPTDGSTTMDAYIRHVNAKFGHSFKSTSDVHWWSIERAQEFWIDLYGYFELKPELPSHIRQAYDPSLPMSSIPEFFPGHKINYAENALFANPDPDAVALIGLRETHDLQREDGEKVTWADVRERVRVVASALKRSGIKKGDRVVALVATSVWAMVLFHATASIGAIFTSISPDLGMEGCVSRLEQITPSILFADDSATYRGKSISTIPKVKQILARLAPGLRCYLIPISPASAQPPTQTPIPAPAQDQHGLDPIDRFLAAASASDPLVFERVPFNYPLVICYSSGTTGAPKCIVHQHGLILQLKKNSQLHNAITRGDMVLHYSSTSWVVFYIMCGHFSIGATCIVYDGSPMFPDITQLLRIAHKYQVNFLGTSPRYLLELSLRKLVPKRDFNLSQLRSISTTGATLTAEQYRWVYANFPAQVRICNTAGGTDTATSLIAADPLGPIRAGEMQTPALGMDVDILDPETGASIAHTGEAGEMVLRRPFPSMPPFFWGDSPDKKTYLGAYFTRFAGVGLDLWAQHDWLARNPVTGGYAMPGRSDGVLNPSGIRFGSGEIYAIVEAPPFTDRVSNTLCVGRRRPQDTDEAVFLFVQPLNNAVVDAQLKAQLRDAIRRGLSPRHVPRFIVPVKEIPVTVNGKKVEVAVKQLISGKDVKPSATVANPDVLLGYTRYRSLEREEDADGQGGAKAKL